MRDDSEYPDRGSVASMQSVLNLPPHLRNGQGDGQVRVDARTVGETTQQRQLTTVSRSLRGSPMQPVGPGDQVRALYDYSDPDKLSFLEVRGAAPHPDRICATTQLTDLLSPCFCHIRTT